VTLDERPHRIAQCKEGDAPPRLKSDANHLVPIDAVVGDGIPRELVLRARGRDFLAEQHGDHASDGNAGIAGLAPQHVRLTLLHDTDHRRRGIRNDVRGGGRGRPGRCAAINGHHFEAKTIRCVGGRGPRGHAAGGHVEHDLLQVARGIRKGGAQRERGVRNPVAAHQPDDVLARIG
jgi:hypothetical protein